MLTNCVEMIKKVLDPTWAGPGLECLYDIGFQGTCDGWRAADSPLHGLK